MTSTFQISGNGIMVCGYSPMVSVQILGYTLKSKTKISFTIQHFRQKLKFKQNTKNNHIYIYIIIDQIITEKIGSLLYLVLVRVRTSIIIEALL